MILFVSSACILVLNKIVTETGDVPVMVLCSAYVSLVTFTLNLMTLISNPLRVLLLGLNCRVVECSESATRQEAQPPATRKPLNDVLQFLVAVGEFHSRDQEKRVGKLLLAGPDDPVAKIALNKQLVALFKVGADEVRRAIRYLDCICSVRNRCPGNFS